MLNAFDELGSVVDFGGGHGSELEVDEGLHVGGLNLNNDKDEDDDKECLDHEWATSDKLLDFIGKELWHEMEHIAKKHQKGDSLVGSTPLQEYLRLEFGENLVKNLLGNAKRRSTEEHPKGCYEVEGDQTTNDGHKPVSRQIRVFLAGQICQWTEHSTEGVPNLIQTQQESMETTPQDEIKGSSMPKSAQQHRHQEVEVLAELAMTIATKGNIEVILEP